MQRKKYNHWRACTQGSTSYNGRGTCLLVAQVDLKHMDQSNGTNMVDVGIDLREFYLSVEWDILEVPAKRNEEYYPEPSKAGRTGNTMDQSKPYPGDFLKYILKQ